ncbi:hypothetical protein P9112_007957 [Eukaryota sp. TZLM1-RC]
MSISEFKFSKKLRWTFLSDQYIFCLILVFVKLFALSFLACLLATALANSHGLTVQGDTDISTCHNARFSARGNLERGSVVWSASNQLIDSLINRCGLSFLKSLSTIQKKDVNPIELLLQGVDEDCSASPEGCPSMMLLTVKDIRHFVATFYESDVNDIKSLIEFLPASLPSLFKDTFATTAIEFVTSIEPELLTATVDNIISVLDDSALDRIFSISGLKLLKEETYLFQWKILNCIPAENVVATFIHLQESKVKIIDTMSILFQGVYCHSINYEGVVDLIEPLANSSQKKLKKKICKISFIASMKTLPPMSTMHLGMLRLASFLFLTSCLPSMSFRLQAISQV